MKKIILGFIVGFILATLLAIPCIRFAMLDKYKTGYKKGGLDGEMKVIGFLNKYFEVRYPPEQYVDKLIMKPGGVFIVNSGDQLIVQTTPY